jgi:hypothetical protein
LEKGSGPEWAEKERWKMQFGRTKMRLEDRKKQDEQWGRAWEDVIRYGGFDGYGPEISQAVSNSTVRSGGILGMCYWTGDD